MKLKNVIRIATLVPLSIYLMYCSYHFIVNEVNPTYLDCGKVMSKSSDEVPIKYGVRTELYLNIQFTKSGFRSIECTPTTYFKSKIGEEICFNLNEDVDTWYVINHMIGLMALGVLGLIAIVLFIGYLI